MQLPSDFQGRSKERRTRWRKPQRPKPQRLQRNRKRPQDVHPKPPDRRRRLPERERRLRRLQEKESEAVRMADTEIKFDAPAALRKWPSLKNERISASLGASPYTVFDGTLDECIRQFMSKPASQQHLYEIHTTPQAELITALLSVEQIVELARLRDFLLGQSSRGAKTIRDENVPSMT